MNAGYPSCQTQQSITTIQFINTSIYNIKLKYTGIGIRHSCIEVVTMKSTPGPVKNSFFRDKYSTNVLELFVFLCAEFGLIVELLVGLLHYMSPLSSTGD